MQSSGAYHALPVALSLALAALVTPLASQTRLRVTTDGAWFYQEMGGKRLARLARGAVLMGDSTPGDWLNVTLEGWIFGPSVGAPPPSPARAGFDLVVTRIPEENLRSAPSGALVAKLPQGFLLAKVDEGSSERWVHVTRAGWVQKADVEPVAPVVRTHALALDTGTGGLTPGRRPGDTTGLTPGRRPGGPGDSAAHAGSPPRGDSVAGPAPVDPGRVEPSRPTVWYRAPEGPPAGTLAPSAPLRVLGRSGEWARVEVQGWVKSADLQTAPPGVLVGVSAAELRADPERYVGQVLRWTVQFIAVQQADELRPDIPAGATYMLARGPLPERGFVYVVIPESRRAQLGSLTPLATLQVTARVRTGRSRFLGNPVLDVLTLEAPP